MRGSPFFCDVENRLFWLQADYFRKAQIWKMRTWGPVPCAHASWKGFCYQQGQAEPMWETAVLEYNALNAEGQD